MHLNVTIKKQSVQLRLQSLHLHGDKLRGTHNTRAHLQCATVTLATLLWRRPPPPLIFH